MSNTQAWIVVAALFAFVYAAGILTPFMIRQIRGSRPPGEAQSPNKEKERSA